MDKLYNLQGRVTLFGLSKCATCKAAQLFLEKNGLEYTYIVMDELSELERARAEQCLAGVNPYKTYPTIVFGDVSNVSIGFNREKVKAALQRMLDGESA